ncbi:MAG: hypothetical protein DI574_09125, partial [Acidovorax sp.]
MALLPLTRRCAMPVLSPFPFRLLRRLAPLGLCALLTSGASAVQAQADSAPRPAVLPPVQTAGALHYQC